MELFFERFYLYFFQNPVLPIVFTSLAWYVLFGSENIINNEINRLRKQLSKEPIDMSFGSHKDIVFVSILFGFFWPLMVWFLIPAGLMMLSCYAIVLPHIAYRIVSGIASTIKTLRLPKEQYLPPDDQSYEPYQSVLVPTQKHPE